MEKITQLLATRRAVAKGSSPVAMNKYEEEYEQWKAARAEKELNKAAAKLAHFGAYAGCSDGGAGLRPFSHIHFTGMG